MTTKQRKHIANIVGLCGILSILTGCTQDTPTTAQQPTTTIEVTDEIQNDNQETPIITDETIVQQQLVIHPGCIGCGRCMQIAPNNFTMSGRHAQVISQDNINSSAIQQAIKNCPAQVIEIIEA